MLRNHIQEPQVSDLQNSYRRNRVSSIRRVTVQKMVKAISKTTLLSESLSVGAAASMGSSHDILYKALKRVGYREIFPSKQVVLEWQRAYKSKFLCYVKSNMLQDSLSFVTYLVDPLWRRTFETALEWPASHKWRHMSYTSDFCRYPFLLQMPLQRGNYLHTM